VRPWPWLGLGFGLDVVPATLSYARATVSGSAPSGGDGTLAVDASAVGVGAHGGVIVRAWRQWLDVAFVYRSAIDLDFGGYQAHGTVPLPHQLVFALASHPLPSLTLTAEARLALWHTLSSPSFVTPAARDTLALAWLDSVGVRAGAAWRLWRDRDGEPRAVVRVGAGWDQGATSPASTSPLLAAGDRVLVGAGAGARWRQVSLDAGYLASIGVSLRAASSGVGNFVARYDGVAHTVAAALTVRLPSLGGKSVE